MQSLLWRCNHLISKLIACLQQGFDWQIWNWRKIVWNYLVLVHFGLSLSVWHFLFCFAHFFLEFFDFFVDRVSLRHDQRIFLKSQSKSSTTCQIREETRQSFNRQIVPQIKLRVLSKVRTVRSTFTLITKSFIQTFIFHFDTCMAAFLSSVRRFRSFEAFTRTVIAWLTSLTASSCCRWTWNKDERANKTQNFQNPNNFQNPTLAKVSLYSLRSLRAWSHCRMAAKKIWKTC